MTWSTDFPVINFILSGIGPLQGGPNVVSFFVATQHARCSSDAHQGLTLCSRLRKIISPEDKTRTKKLEVTDGNSNATLEVDNAHGPIDEGDWTMVDLDLDDGWVDLGAETA